MKLDLSKYCADVKHLHDIDKGRAIADELNVLSLFEGASGTQQQIVLCVPDSVYGISTSFVNGFFGSTVESLGKQVILKHLVIDAEDHIVLRVIDAIERADVNIEQIRQAELV